MEEKNNDNEKQEIKNSNKKLSIGIGIFILALLVILAVVIAMSVNTNKTHKCPEVKQGTNERNNDIYDIDPFGTQFTDDKPIIYIYPNKESKVEVKLGKKENITCSYPKYIDGWKVLAKPNGDLVDLDTNKKLYALYYEALNDSINEMKDEGFIVKGEDSASFLEEKLKVLGLTERESEEFIVYWLPKLEANKYNYIYFANMEEIEATMPLEVSPKPETLIRVMMIFKGLDKPINIKEQKLTEITRKGYTVVEWGGSQLK